MAKETRYFAWKDGKQTDGQTQEWTEITQEECRNICADSKARALDQRRYFMRVPGIEAEDTCFLFECNYTQYKKYRAEKEQKARNKKIRKNDASKYGSIRRLSLDAKYLDPSGNPFTLHELVTDPTTQFEDDLVDKMTLKAALAQLNQQERRVIDILFLENTDNMNEFKISAQIGVPQTTINYQKRRICEKLKNYFVKK